MDDQKISIENITDIFSALPKINSDNNFWMVRANKGEYYNDFVQRQYVGIGFNKISLEEAKTKTNEQLHALFKERMPVDDTGKTIPEGTYTSWVGQLRRFVDELKPNDYILVPSKSSDYFSLGVITGQPNELTQDQIDNLEIVEGRKNSPYRKRISVQFLTSFNRTDADPALYKMIYTQTTLSKINKYASYILRASYDAYISGDKLYLTFPVKQKENIHGRPFTSFTYHLTESYYNLTKKDSIIKSNVQSEGMVQLIVGLSSMAGLFLILLVVLKSKIGFTIDIDLKEGKFSFKKEDKGIVAERIQDARFKRKTEGKDKQLEQINKTVDIMNKAGFSMEEIQAEVSEELNSAIRKADNPTDDSEDDLH